MKKKREKLKDVKKDKYVKIIILIIALFLLFILLFLVNIIFLKLNLFTIFFHIVPAQFGVQGFSIYLDGNNVLYTGRDNTLYTGGVWTFSDEESNITNETIGLIKNALNEGLPLAGNWNSGTFDQNWQVNTLIPDGHVIMPWFGIPWSGFWNVDYSWKSLVNNYEPGMSYAALNKLPIAFKSPQWEEGLITGGWCSRPDNENPCYQKLDGTYTQELGPLGAVDAWYQIGYASANQSYLKKIQEIYPDPPLVVFLENNEATKNGDLLNNKQYIDKYGSDPSYKDSAFMAKIGKEAWDERYAAMLKGFNDALVSNTWKAKAIQIPYIGYGGSVGSVLNQKVWDGSMPSLYTARYQGFRDYLVNGPQVLGGNLKFGFEEMRRTLKPNFFSDVITWYGDVSAVQGLEQSGQTFTPERYRGTTQFVLWEVQPQLLNEFRGSTQSRSGWYGQLFNILLNSVDRVHYNPVLRKFWKEGMLVANNRSTYFKQSLPSEYINADTFFVLDSDANSGMSWGSSSSVVNVFSLAYMIGESPNRQWLLYTHAPLGTRQNVNITIPNYKKIQVPTVEQGGSFYLINESTNTVESIGSLNFAHNHAPVAVNDEYQLAVGETLNITNKWATIGSKPLWFNDIDADGDTLTAVLVSNLSHGTLNLNADGTFVYTPEQNFVGTDTFTYKMNDGQLNSNIATVTLKLAGFAKLIDDGDLGYSEVSMWQEGSISGTYVGYGDKYKWHAAGADIGLEPISKAVWTIDSLPSDTYDVYTTWAPSWSRTTGAPYSVFDGTTKLGAIIINQQNAPSGVTIGATPWQKLGSYNVQGGTLKVQVTSEAPWVVTGKTVVVADAIRVVQNSTSKEWYVDNKDAGYSETTFWNSQKSANSYGGDRRMEVGVDSRDGSPEKKAIWNFTDLAPGVYNVFTTWSASSLNNAGTVNYKIIKGGQTLTKTVSQKESPSTLLSGGIWWQSLGEYLVEDGMLKVELSNYVKSGRIFADAVGLIGVPMEGMIIDDGDAGYKRIGSFHGKSGGFRGDGDYMYSEKAGVWDAANWTFNDLPAGSYKVYVTWSDPDNWAPNADVNYAVFDSNEKKGLVSLSQHDSPADKYLDNKGWKDLGTFDINSGILNVKVSAAANHSVGRVSADAVWIIALNNLSCLDQDSDSFGVCPSCNMIAGCRYNGNDCDDNNRQINPMIKEGWILLNKWATCNDNIDNDCNNKIDCSDSGCFNSPMCSSNVNTSLLDLPKCIKPIQIGNLAIYFKNNSFCDDNNGCTNDTCTIEGCRYRFLSKNKVCLDLIRNCTDSDKDGMLDYNPINCTIGKDKCIENIPAISFTKLAPIMQNANLSWNITTQNIRNLSNFSIYKLNIGKIRFKNKVNLLSNNETGCFQPVRLDTFIFIIERKIIINSSEFNGLNSSATLEFYNIENTNPKILRDGVNCADCNITSYDNSTGILVVDVSGFSTYEVVENGCGNLICDNGETCSTCLADCGSCINDGAGGSGAGSGGGGGIGGSGGMERGSAVVNNINNNPTQDNNTTQMNLLNIPNSRVSNLTESPTKENGRYGNIFYYAILIIILIAIIIIFIILIKIFKRENALNLYRKNSVSNPVTLSEFL